MPDWAVGAVLGAGVLALVALDHTEVGRTGWDHAGGSRARPPRSTGRGWSRGDPGGAVVALVAGGLLAVGVHLPGSGAPAFAEAVGALVLLGLSYAVAGPRHPGGVGGARRLGSAALVVTALGVGGIAVLGAHPALLVEAEVAAALGLAWTVLGPGPGTRLAPGLVLGTLALQAGATLQGSAPQRLVVSGLLLVVPLSWAVAGGASGGASPPAPDPAAGVPGRAEGVPPAGRDLTPAGAIETGGLVRGGGRSTTGGSVAASGSIAGAASARPAGSAVAGASPGALHGSPARAGVSGGPVAGAQPTGVAWIVVLEIAAAGGALAVARAWIPVEAGALVAAVSALGAGVAGVCGRRRAGPVLRRWRWLWLAPLGAVVLLGLLGAPAVLAGLRARSPAAAGQAAALAGVNALAAGRFPTAAADFAAAATLFRRSQAALESPVSEGGLAVPVLATNLRVARRLVAAGVILARTGARLATGPELPDLHVSAGALPVARLQALAPQLRAVVGTLRGQLASLEHADRTYLFPELSRLLDRAEHRVRVGLADAREATDIATYVPRLLGSRGPQRYFVMTQDPAEARATGGFMGSWGELVATDGHLSLARLGRTDQLNTGGSAHRVLDAPADYLARYGQFDPAYAWQDINMSPDFPTVGRIVAGLYPQAGGTTVDGVVAIDPSGLAALLRLTGPVRIPAWPVPLTAANVVRVTTFSSYVAYAGNHDERVEFLSQVARATFQALSGVHLDNLAGIAADIGAAVREHHLMVYATAPAEEAFLARQGVAGAVPPLRCDALEVTSQNAAGNKVDYFLHEALNYTLTLEPRTGPGGVPTTAAATGALSLTLHDGAPAAGLPRSIIGPYDANLSAGEAREFVTVYTPLGFGLATLDGVGTSLSSGRELGRNAYSTFIDVAAGGTATLDLRLAGTLHLRRGGWYELELPVQPMVNADTVRVQVRVSGTWRVVQVRGAARVGPAEVSAVLHPRAQTEIWVRLAPR